MIRDNFYVITGGPGVGKTSLINELSNRGYQCVPEVARGIIKNQQLTDGDALPWKNAVKYRDLMLKKSIDDFIDSFDKLNPVFFDRGILDSLCYSSLIDSEITDDLLRIGNKYRYNKTVFILTPWKDIYTTDQQRKQSWDEVLKTHKAMVDTYQKFDYQLIRVPKFDVADKVDFIIKHITEK
jgi:predicted ATPase